MSSATRRWVPSMVFIRTLQSTEPKHQRQSHAGPVPGACDVFLGACGARAFLYAIAALSRSNGRGLVCAARGSFLARVVAALGSDGEPVVAVRARVYLNSAVAARALRSGGFVADSVLVADIMSHGTADGIDLVQGFG